MRTRIISIFVFFFLFGSLVLYPQEMGPWERVDPGSGFGDIENWGVYSMAVYNGHLYVGTGYNTANGFEVWRYDGVNWIRVATGGLGDVNECSAWSMAVYEGRLYVGGGGEVDQYPNPSRVYVYTSGIKKNLIYKYDFKFIVYFDDFNLLGGNLILQAGLDRFFGVIQQLYDLVLKLDNGASLFQLQFEGFEVFLLLLVDIFQVGVLGLKLFYIS